MKPANVYLTTADTACLPFIDHSFDAILSTFTLELFDSVEIPLVLHECWRVLMPGGRMVIAALNKPSSPNRAIVLYEWFHRAFPRLVDCHPIPVVQHLTKTGFQIAEINCVSLWGLQVLIASSYKKSA
jgi:ubiquinone/menaquinone biosynthesis C-methylase UbiE